MSAILANDLSRRFGRVRAVDGLDLEVRSGEVYGFLGPNGAGKSTTINMLLGFTPPTAGSGSVLGHDIKAESLAIRQNIGVLPEDFGLYNRLTARKHVQFAIDVKDAYDDADALLDRVGLTDASDRKAGGFSTGMKQRLALAMALVGEPELLILDEPSSGLDPNGAREMRQIITGEVERGATVFFSSHIMEQVEAICDRVGIMRDGQLIAEDTIDGLKERYDGESQLIVSVDTVPDGTVDQIEVLEGISTVHVEGTDVVVGLADAGRKAAVINTVEAAGGTVTDITTEEASLDDLFRELTTGEQTADTRDSTQTEEVNA